MKNTLLAGFLSLSALACSAEPFEQSFYVRTGLGGRQISGGGFKNENPDRWIFCPEISMGYQSPTPFGMELGLSTGIFNNNSTVNLPGLYSLSVMPTLRLPMAGLFGRNCFHTLGLQIGESYFTESVEKQGSYYSSVDYYQAQTVIYGLCYRVEQMFGRRVSLGLDLGYQWAVYHPADYSGRPAMNPDGSQRSLDFSGPSIKLSLAFWMRRPFISAMDKATDATRRFRKKNRVRRRPRVADQDVEVVKSPLRSGDVEMENKNYSEAVNFYQQAVVADPGDRWAWQGLANAQYYLGNRREALEAYERAFAFSNDDEKLRQMIEKLKEEGHAGIYPR